ncbi:hypothetical protein TRFO_14707 [Tritrichomonas foetus]|uniref:Uncharacterized protein n=1 Tax=Tritrichomonas foetus TaxID=1144522 RepID=A0A1J4KYX5_9EUKA|nr:hypothetical protein TRFO_14707 [Tritrichomonas foetus]|eukprot:OHT14910.1 hypothetical protein TRFO_14707 [Tritrichomonas foetus]
MEADIDDAENPMEALLAQSASLVFPNQEEKIHDNNPKTKIVHNDQTCKLSQRQSSYANLRLNNTFSKPNEKAKSQRYVNLEENENPVIVLTDKNDDDSNAPIGLSIRQPSFSSLHGYIIPKGTPENNEIQLVIEENENQMRQEGQKNNNKLSTKQSSYANLDEPGDNDLNPVIVLTNDIENDEEDDDNDQPIGLSVRQPSFASLKGNVIPKGGIEATIMPLVVEENEEQPRNVENVPMNLSQRQSSYVNLHLSSSHQKDDIRIPNHLIEPISENVEENPIIVLVGSDDDDNDNDNNENSNIQIGLSVRQPSFASLNGMVIPKGGFEATVMPLVIEEESDQVSMMTNQNNEKIDFNVRQSSYTNLKILVNPDEITEIDGISEETYDGNIDDDNPIIVLTDEISDENAPIGLSVRQPSFASLDTHNIIPKGGFTSTRQIIEEEIDDVNEENNVNLDEPDDEVKQQILTSLSTFNQEWWKQIGYAPEKPNMKTNNKQIPKYKSYMDFDFISYKPIDPKINNISVDEKKRISNEQPRKKIINQCSSQLAVHPTLTLIRINSSGREISKVEMPGMDHYENDENIYMNKGPSLMRVNSFGNKSSLKIVEMPIISERNQLYNDNSIEHSSETPNMSGSDNSNPNTIMDEIDNEIINSSYKMQNLLHDWEKQLDEIDSKLEQDLKESEEKYHDDYSMIEEAYKLELNRINNDHTSSADMRKTANKMLNSRNFKAASQLVVDARLKEKKYNHKAINRARNEYITSRNQLKDEYENEKNQLILEYTKKRSSLIKEREKSISPMRNNMMTLMKMRKACEKQNIHQSKSQNKDVKKGRSSLPRLNKGSKKHK